jgi:signal transduction histidine kinase
LSREEFASRRWPDLLADREEEVIDRLGSALHRRGDGSLFPVEFSTGSFQWQGRARVVAVVRDITERRRLEGAREEVFSMVSHEMRTPLTAILGFSEYLMENDAALEQRVEFLHLIVRESERLGVLIDNLLGLQRLRAGFGLEDPVPVQLHPLLREVAESFRTPLCRRRIDIDCDDGIPSAFGDSGKIELAMKNLVGNAVKYSPADGTIVLGARAEVGHVLLWVRDEGPGIAADQQEKIFERFYRASGCKGSAGTGLGLALVREVAQAHGGRSWVESMPGQGSTFYLSLPCAT